MSKLGALLFYYFVDIYIQIYLETCSKVVGFKPTTSQLGNHPYHATILTPNKGQGINLRIE